MKKNNRSRFLVQLAQSGIRPATLTAESIYNSHSPEEVSNIAEDQEITNKLERIFNYPTPECSTAQPTALEIVNDVDGQNDVLVQQLERSFNSPAPECSTAQSSAQEKFNDVDGQNDVLVHQLGTNNLITPEDLGINVTGNKGNCILADNSDIELSSDRSVFDDSCADPDYTESDGNKKLRKKCPILRGLEISESDLSADNVPTELEKPKRRKTTLKRLILTEKEKIQRNKAKYPFIPNTCKCSAVNSKNMCHLIDNQKRNVIWNHYWNCDYTTRRKWLSKNVNSKPIKRVKVNAEKNRNESREYYLEDPETKERHKVCQSYFLKTLGYQSDAVITSLMKAKRRLPCDTAVKENRGKHERPPIQKANIMKHINSFHPCRSHYRRHNAPYVRYLPQGLTLKKMYDDYVNKNPALHYSSEMYRKIMKEMYVSLHTPKSDLCGECEIYKLKKAEQKLLKLQDMAQHAAHKFKANYATSMYQKDAASTTQSDTKIVAVDLQKVFVLPIMPAIKDSIFISRLIAFNLTFAPLKKGEKATCVLWHEEISERDAKNIVDAFYKYIKSERDIKHFIFWADNCTAQNKNWILFTSLVKIVNESTSLLETITINYLTKGHTHNAADSVHGNIERALTKTRNIYDFDDLKEVVIKSRKHIKILEINPLEDKYDWIKKKRQPSTKPSKDNLLKTIRLNNVTSVQFRKGSRNMFFKTIQAGMEFNELDFLQKRFNADTETDRLAKRRGINPTKKTEILEKLVPYMPENRRYFWRSLESNESSSDLITQEITSDD